MLRTWHDSQLKLQNHYDIYVWQAHDYVHEPIVDMYVPVPTRRFSGLSRSSSGTAPSYHPPPLPVQDSTVSTTVFFDGLLAQLDRSISRSIRNSTFSQRLGGNVGDSRRASANFVSSNTNTSAADQRSTMQQRAKKTTQLELTALAMGPKTVAPTNGSPPTTPEPLQNFDNEQSSHGKVSGTLSSLHSTTESPTPPGSTSMSHSLALRSPGGASTIYPTLIHPLDRADDLTLSPSRPNFDPQDLKPGLSDRLIDMLEPEEALRVRRARALQQIKDTQVYNAKRRAENRRHAQNEAARMPSAATLVAPVTPGSEPVTPTKANPTKGQCSKCRVLANVAQRQNAAARGTLAVAELALKSLIEAKGNNDDIVQKLRASVAALREQVDFPSISRSVSEQA